MQVHKEEKIKDAVRKDYGQMALRSVNGCGCGCGPGENSTLKEASKKLGYSNEGGYDPRDDYQGSCECGDREL
jgi:hypothetical protein